MKKKEFIDNNCQLCHYSIKEYLCADNRFSLNGAKFCLCAGLTSKEKKKRMCDKVKCDHFRLAKMSKGHQLNDVSETLMEISRQLEWVKHILSELKNTDE